MRTADEYVDALYLSDDLLKDCLQRMTEGSALYRCIEEQIKVNEELLK